MFLSLLIATFVAALAVSAVTARLFAPSIDGILRRIVGDAISAAWRKYMAFAVYVTGVSKGVRVYDLERYANPERWRPEGGEPLVLNANRWVLEVYRTIIESLQGIAWLLLVFFVFALVAYVIVRGLEMRRKAE